MAQRSVEIQTPDGICPADLSIPSGEGPWPAIVMYPDAGGMRDVMREMGKHLSNFGYVVLVPDIYYRSGPYDTIDMRTAFSDKETADRIMTMMAAYTADKAIADAKVLVDYLNSMDETRAGGVGTTGYCLGGRLSLLVATNLGDKVAGAASFHGGGIAKADDPDSPHHKAGSIRARIYVAGASEDPSFTDDDKALLERSLTEASVAHTIETYPAQHGFAVPDNPRYDEASAEAHWKATEHFFAEVFG